MLDHGYWTYPNCCAEFTSEAILNAAQYKHAQEPTLQRSIIVAMKLTECGREGAAMLRGLQRKKRSIQDTIHIKIEYAMAQVALRRYHSAARISENAVEKIKEAGVRTFITSYIRGRHVHGQALLGLGMYSQAGAIWSDLLQYVSRMTSEEALKVMTSIADTCLA